MAERERLFGNDLRLAPRAPGFDLVGNAAGDLDQVRGNDNIVQALIMRLKVRQGELAPLGWPNFGSRLYELLGAPNNARTHVMLMAHARKAIEQDPRVAEVRQVRTEVLRGEPETVRLIMDILLIDTPNPLNLVFDINLESP
jgi:phage baseplate assembly protein W